MRLLFASLITTQLFAAIGVTEPVAEVNSTTNASSYAMTAFTPAANATLVVLAFASGTVAAGTVTSSPALTWTKKTSIAYNAGLDTAYVFWARTGSAPASTTVTFNCTGDAATGAVVTILQFTDSDMVTPDPIKQVKTVATTAANPTITFDTAMGTLNGYGAGFGLPRSPPTSTPPASWTETVDVGYSTPTAGASVAYRAGGETGSTVTFTSASAAYGMVAVEVYVTGAGPVGSSQGVYRRRSG